jgi:hypothetical protein
MKRLLHTFAIAAFAAASPAVPYHSGLGTPQPPELTQTPPPSVTQPQPPPPAAPTPGQPGQAGGRGRGGTPAPGRALPSLPNPAANVKLELSITDTYSGMPTKKVVTLLVANSGNGMIRTLNRLPDGNLLSLNVDAYATVFSGGVIRVDMTFQYTPAQGGGTEGKPAPRPADLNESVEVLLQDGKTTVVSQSADPATDRKVTAEVTATIVK